MKPKKEQFPAKNPNPVLSVEKDGTVLYSNVAGEPLLHEWGVGVGEKLPSYIGDFVQRVISLNGPEKMEVKVGKRVYLITFHPIPEEECVNIYGFDISDQKELEGKLRESERKYHLLFENMLDGFAYCRMLYDDCSHPVDYIYLNTNSAFERLTGLKDVNGKRATELFPGIKESHPELFDIYGRVALTGQPERFEIEFKPLGMWFSISVYSMEKEHFVAVFDNITKRKQLEEQTRQRVEELETVLDVAPVAIWIGHDPQSQCITGNRATNELYEVEAGENVSANATSERRFFYKGRELAADELPMQQASLNDIDVRNSEFDILLPSGEWRAFLGSASPLHDAEGHVRGSVGAFIDFTERKRVEEELRQSLEDLDRAQAVGQIGWWRLDTRRNILTWSDENHRIFGVPMGTPLTYETFLGIVHPDDRQCVDTQWNAGLRGEPYDIEHRIVVGQQVKWVREKAYLEFDEAGNLAGGFGITQNITERKRAEEELLKAYEQIRTQSEELQVFNEELQAQSEELRVTNEALNESEKRFRTLAENSPDIIARFDRQNRHTYVNPATAKVYGLSQEEMIGKTLDELRRDPEQVRFLETYYEIVFATGKTETMEFQYKSPQGKEYYFSKSIVPEFVDGKVTSILTISHDITDIKEAEAKLKETLDNLDKLVKERTDELEETYKSLKESEKSLAEAQEMTHIGNWDRNLVTNELYWSDEMYRIFGLNPQEFIVTYNVLLSRLHPEDRDYVDNAVKGALKGEPFDIDHRIILANGEERIVHAQGKAIFNEENIPIRIRGTVQDITERKRGEMALRESETRLRRFYESGMVGVLYYNMNGSIIEANDKFLEMVGYTREDLRAGRIKWDKMTPPEYRPLEEYAIAELKAIGVATPYEKEYIRKDGSRIPIILGAANIDETRNDGVAFVLDITEQKKAEEYLAKIEIARKQEIHHRIKNNLQVISSLLDLQSEKFRDRNDIKDSEVLQAFRESQDRVISMALIHEELYRGGGFDTLDFSPYIEELAENLFLTYKLGNADISLKTDLEEDLFFGMDTAVPLGMIVNELVSNSLKHAFLGRDKGEILIKLHREENGECINSIEESKNEDCESTSFTLTVSDNGIGIPEDLEIEDLDTLGFQLVTTLVDQLDGELELKRENGTEFVIRFIVTEKNNQASAPAPQQLVE